MIRLGELVGAVLSEMTIARAQAALFAAQMAADFREHALLSTLPIPVYRIGRAEVSLPFVVADVIPGGDATGRAGLTASDVAEAARRAVAALAEEEALEEAFSLYANQVQRWRRDAAPAVAERLAPDAAESLSVAEISRICGYLAKAQYLLSLVRGRVSARRLQECVEAGHPELVEGTAERLLRRELEGIPGRGAQPAADEAQTRRSTPTVEKGDIAMYVSVEARELEDREQVAVLRLELDESTLEQMTLVEPEEAGRE